MAEPVPVTELSDFSSPNATPTEWSQARDELADAEVYWLSTVRPDGRPHVTPLLGIWLEDALYFCTGPDERKAKNWASPTKPDNLYAASWLSKDSSNSIGDMYAMELWSRSLLYQMSHSKTAFLASSRVEKCVS
jgi:hypothetical protein